jgi:aminomethyltransferase
MPAPMLKQTPLFDLHGELGARMTPFAGYEMPVQYPAGILAEHLHTRARASLFDVSHMGQLALRGERRVAALEALVPADIQGLARGAMRYTVLTNQSGGILDDLIVTNVGEYLFLVVNASRKAEDIAHLEASLEEGLEADCELTELADRALLALQGPMAARVLARLIPDVTHMDFMTAAPFEIDGVRLAVTRSGYTGEDGFEISIPSADADGFARRLLAEDEVAPAGLGARDSLRLEAGLCLYGHDMDDATTPIEAGLAWTIARRRRDDGGFPGADIILAQLRDGVARRRVGFLPEGKAPAREHTVVTNMDGAQIGEITSGGFGPSVGGPVAMGYIDSSYSHVDTPVQLMVRGVPRPAHVCKMPAIAHNYFKA